jgi:hypothetical protein
MQRIIVMNKASMPRCLIERDHPRESILLIMPQLIRCHLYPHETDGQVFLCKCDLHRKIRYVVVVLAGIFDKRKSRLGTSDTIMLLDTSQRRQVG